MQPNWDDIRIFLSYLRNGSIKSTSAELKISGPTISRRIDGLQKCIGHPLFRRTPGGIELLSSTHALVAIWEEAEALLQYAPMSVEPKDETAIIDLRFSTTPALASALVFPNLARFQADWPQVHVEIDTSVHVRDLSVGESDVALRLIEPIAGNLIRQKLASLRFGVFAAKHVIPQNFVLAETWEELQSMGLPAITWSQSAVVSMPQERLKQALGNQNAGVTISDFCGLMDGIGNGLGIGILPEILGNQLPGLQQVARPGLVNDMQLWLVVSQRLAQYPHVIAFQSFLKSTLSEQSRCLRH